MIRGGSALLGALVILLSGCLGGCAAVFKVRSEPLQADVSVIDAKTGEGKPLGKTPVDITQQALRQALGESAPGGYFVLKVEKQGYVTEKLLVPEARFGTLISDLSVKLKPGENPREDRLAREVLSHLFLAQKLALAKEYDRAQAEIDRILYEFPEFPRALSMRGSIYYLQKKFSESAQWFERAAKADPQMEDAVQMLAKIRAAEKGGRVPAAGGGAP